MNIFLSTSPNLNFNLSTYVRDFLIAIVVFVYPKKGCVCQEDEFDWLKVWNTQYISSYIRDP